MTESASGTPAVRRIDGRLAFQAAVREALAEVAQVGCKEIFLIDRDFANWPLGEAEVVEALTRWSFAHRKLTMVAERYEDVARCHARFARWRVQHAHVIDCRAAHEDDARDLPTLLVAPGLLTLRMVDPLRFRGYLDHTPAEWVRLRDQIDAIAQRSTESFPASTLGL